MSTPEIRRATLEDHYSQVRDLPLKNWRESGRGDIPLSIDIEKYLLAERAGILRVYGAWIDGTLVGYAMFVLSRHPQYRETVYATQEVVYVDKASRPTMLGIDLMHFVEDDLRKDGVHVLQQSQPIGNVGLGKLLRFIGYEPIETVWIKRLDRVANALKSA